jgi:hypothetical protein
VARFGAVVEYGVADSVYLRPKDRTECNRSKNSKRFVSTQVWVVKQGRWYWEKAGGGRKAHPHPAEKSSKGRHMVYLYFRKGVNNNNHVLTNTIPDTVLNASCVMSCGNNI